MTNKAIFLDRDGTINIEKNFLYRCPDFSFLPRVPQALKRLQDAGYLLIVVTNQSGIARGYYDFTDVQRLHEYMQEQLLGYEVSLAGIYICPHHPDGDENNLYIEQCECRKPQPGLLLQAARELSIDLSKSYMIGDKLSDVEAGHRAGCRSFLVTSGHKLSHLDVVPPYCSAILPGLWAVANYIVDHEATFR